MIASDTGCFSQSDVPYSV